MDVLRQLSEPRAVRSKPELWLVDLAVQKSTRDMVVVAAIVAVVNGGDETLRRESSIGGFFPM